MNGLSNRFGENVGEVGGWLVIVIVIKRRPFQ